MQHAHVHTRMLQHRLATGAPESAAQLAYPYCTANRPLYCAGYMMVLYYRADVFRALGLSPPRTWEEAVLIAEALNGTDWAAAAAAGGGAGVGSAAGAGSAGAGAAAGLPGPAAAGSYGGSSGSSHGGGEAARGPGTDGGRAGGPGGGAYGGPGGGAYGGPGGAPGAQGGRPRWGFCLHMPVICPVGQSFHAILGSLVQSKGPRQGVHFDPETMQPVSWDALDSQKTGIGRLACI